MKRHKYKIQGGGSNLISFAVMAYSAFLVGAAYAAYLVPTNGSRSWGDPSVWYTDEAGTSPLGSVPTTENNNTGFAYLCGTSFTSDNPIVIGAGTIAKAFLMQFASKAGETVYMRVDEGGVLGPFISADYGHNAIGCKGRGVLLIDGGAWTNNYSSVGYAAGAEGIVTNLGGRMYLYDLQLGYLAGAKGSIVIDGGMLSHANDNYPKTWAVGSAGEGVLELKSGTIDGSDLTLADNGGGKVPLHLGCAAGGRGTFRMSGGYLEGVYLRAGYAAGATGIVEITGGSTTRLRSFDIGYDGVGYANVSCNWTPGRMHIGYQGDACGELTVCNGATNAVQNFVSKFGILDDGFVYIGGHPETSGGFGRLILRGGTLRIMDDAPSTNKVWIGCNPTAFGSIRGWGRVMPYSTTSTYSYKMNIALGNGTIVADGEGVNHLLDFGDVQCVTNYYPNPADGTNGWYAINKGCVHFPSRWDLYNQKSRALGTSHSMSSPDFVNSVVVRLAQSVSGGGSTYGGFYAADRDDIHADSLPVPEKGSVIGVWKLGIGESRRNWEWSNIKPLTVTGTVGADFRYDLTRVSNKGASRLKLYRWTGADWQCVTKAKVDPLHPVISASGLPALEGSVNIGLFALVVMPVNGTTVLIR